jgi:hypothetical protein
MEVDIVFDLELKRLLTLINNDKNFAIFYLATTQNPISNLRKFD